MAEHTENPVESREENASKAVRYARLAALLDEWAADNSGFDERAHKKITAELIALARNSHDAENTPNAAISSEESAKPAHTPLPWKIGVIANSKVAPESLGIFHERLAVDGHRVRAVCILSPVAIATEEDEGNAELIRVACNSHHALLAACKAWVDYFDRLCRDDEPGDPLAEARNKYHAARVNQTRAAIALAEGGAK